MGAEDQYKKTEMVQLALVFNMNHHKIQVRPELLSPHSDSRKEGKPRIKHPVQNLQHIPVTITYFQHDCVNM